MTSQKFEVSIVVPTINTSVESISLISQFCKSLKKSNLSTEMIIVDDGSSFEKRKILRQELNQIISSIPIKLVLLSKNCGQFVATRYGISNAEGEFIVTLDDDTIFSVYSLIETLDFVRTADFDFVVCLPRKYEQRTKFRDLGTFLTRVIGRSVYKTESNHRFSSIIIFRSRFILELARSNQFRSIPGWFYNSSQYFTNVWADLTKLNRRSNYKIGNLLKSFGTIITLLLVKISQSANRLFSAAIALVIALSSFQLANTYKSPVGYRSIFILVIISISLSLLSLKKISVIGGRSLDTREGQVPFSVQKFY